MKTHVKIEAGICGFKTSAVAESEDSQSVTFHVESDCEKIVRLAAALKMKEPIDAFQEINPAGESVLMTTVREVLCGCCAGCAVPVGLFKAMQVTAGLALPKDIVIQLRQE